MALLLLDTEVVEEDWKATMAEGATSAARRIDDNMDCIVKESVGAVQVFDNVKTQNTHSIIHHFFRVGGTMRRELSKQLPHFFLWLDGATSASKGSSHNTQRKIHLNIIVALAVCVLECALLSLQDVRVICVCVGIIRVAQVVA